MPASALLEITDAELQALPPQIRAQVKATLNLRQAMYDILGQYPQENVLPYFYGTTMTAAASNAIPANGQVTQSIRITADAGFIGCAIVGTSTGDYTFFMRTDASDRQLQNIPVHSTAGVGTAQRPGKLWKPLLLPPNTTLSIDFQDLSGSENEVYWYQAGFKVYNRRIG